MGTPPEKSIRASRHISLQNSPDMSLQPCLPGLHTHGFLQFGRHPYRHLPEMDLQQCGAALFPTRHDLKALSRWPRGKGDGADGGRAKEILDTGPNLAVHALGQASVQSVAPRPCGPADHCPLERTAFLSRNASTPARKSCVPAHLTNASFSSRSESARLFWNELRSSRFIAP